MSHYMRADRKQFVKSPQDFIIRPLLRQRETGTLCDIILRVNGRTFTAHKAILALWSPYFHSMFTCEMREKVSSEIDLSESLMLDDPEKFGIVLDYLYTGAITVTVSNVEDVLRISDFLLLDEVKDYCKQFYLDLGNLDLSNCLRIRFLAENHNLPEVAETCQNIIESRFHDYLIFHDEILDLQPEFFFLLLESPGTLHSTVYNDLKKLVQRWVEHDKPHRERYLDDLYINIKLYLYESCEVTSALSTHDRKPKLSKRMQSSLSEKQRGACMSHNFCHRYENVLHRSMTLNDSICPILYAVVSNQGMKFMKMLVFSVLDQKWFHFPFNGEKLCHMIPSRQSISALVAHGNCLYMYLCSSFPYPTDMLKIYILALDMLKGQPILYSFKTGDYYNPCYRTTLTNHRSVPPAMVACGPHLYVVGNREGTGNLFLCNMNNSQYKCFPIPGARFISLARAAVKNDRLIFLWFRHRTGPSEEFCIKKSVGFAIFDTKSQLFNSWEISPPEISYDEFSRPYSLCVRDETVLIYHPGRPALVLDEVRCKWILSLRKLPTHGPLTDSQTDIYGYRIQATTENSIFILNNDAPFTTSMIEISESYPSAIIHKPPPIDNISLVAAGHLTRTDVQGLEPFDRYDDSYTNALQVTMRLSDQETEDSGTTPSDHDSDNAYEYDEDIYDYDYDLEGDFGF
ncbi:hypothetical protein FSP39_008123 [Pinctada imbricata]|uniref:BTB domain-containing protein n=1 Tax=Pinctada imbricata TaxID=66713 RepID=A0AA88XZ48_PINIB|nr:hypothetical protein FSP39_008123 [Pinctada imbricata]